MCLPSSSSHVLSRSLGPGFTPPRKLHSKNPLLHLFLIHLGYGLFRALITLIIDEPETSRLPGKRIHNYFQRLNLPKFRELAAQVALGNILSEIAHINSLASLRGHRRALRGLRKGGLASPPLLMTSSALPLANRSTGRRTRSRRVPEY